MSRAHRISATVLSGLFVLSVTSAPARAQDHGARAVEGVWAMSLTLRDCATGAPLGPPFRSLVTFHAGGTLSESQGATQFAPGQRSSGHGVWSYSGGNTFATRFIAMILFDTPPAPPAPGFQAGWLVVGANFTVIDATRLSVTATAQFFELNQNLYRSACPTGTAEQFK